MSNSSPVMKTGKNNAALVTVDPQNDSLSDAGVAWDLVGKSVQEYGTVAHLGQMLETARANSFLIFNSPHYYCRFVFEIIGKMKQASTNWSLAWRSSSFLILRIKMRTFHSGKFSTPHAA